MRHHFSNKPLFTRGSGRSSWSFFCKMCSSIDACAHVQNEKAANPNDRQCNVCYKQRNKQNKKFERERERERGKRKKVIFIYFRKLINTNGCKNIVRLFCFSVVFCFILFFFVFVFFSLIFRISALSFFTCEHFFFSSFSIIHNHCIFQNIELSCLSLFLYFLS